MKITRYVVLFLLFLSCSRIAEAYNSKAWRERLDARTVTLWVEGQMLGDNVVLYSRGRLDVTWLERGLVHRLEEDRDVEEWLLNGLNYYSSNRKDTQAKVRRRDVFVLNYKASKHWDFTPTKLVIGGYRIISDDILTKKEYWDDYLAPGDEGSVAVVAPPLKPGQKVEIQYEDARATLNVPRR